MTSTWIPILAALACGDGLGGFGSNGTRYSGGGGDDTAVQGGDCADFPNPKDGNGPGLGDPSVSLTEYPNIGDVCEVVADYCDPQDDLVGGEVILEVTGGDYDHDQAKGQIKSEGATGSMEAWAAEGVLHFAFGPVDSWETYELKLQVADKRGHRSNVVEATCESAR